MARLISISVETDFQQKLEKLTGPVLEKVLFSGAAAGAKAFYDEVKINVSGIRANTPGIVTGNLYDAIYWAQKKETNTPTSKTYQVGWNHAIAPHGHLLEYGTVKAPAYPFIRPAIYRSPEAYDAAVKRMRERFNEEVNA